MNLGPAPNPFSALVYKPHSDLYTDPEEQDDRASQYGNQTLPLELHFCMETGDAALDSPKLSARLPIDLATPSLPKPKEVFIREENIQEDKLDDEEIAEIVPLNNENFSPLPQLPISSLKSQLSRVEKSRLQSAGFEHFYDEHGNLPELYASNVLDRSMRIDYSTESNDERHNEITIQFMALTLTDDFKDRSGNKLPDSVNFSFQFYTFPEMSTERLKLYRGSLPPSYDPQSNMTEAIWPGLLYRLEPDGRSSYDRPPGISVQFHVDQQMRKSCSNSRYGLSSFPFYMDNKQLYVDVWDGDSLLHLGTACVDLRAALRQGKSAVLIEDDVDIIWNEVSSLTDIVFG